MKPPIGKRLRRNSTHIERRVLPPAEEAILAKLEAFFFPHIEKMPLQSILDHAQYALFLVSDTRKDSVRDDDRGKLLSVCRSTYSFIRVYLHKRKFPVKFRDKTLNLKNRKTQCEAPKN